jgi:hypothetical protein
MGERSKLSSQPIMRKRLIWGVAIAATYVAAVLVSMPSLPSGFDPDTAGYLEFSPYRQPMYGLWANAVHAFSGSWHTVRIMQVGMFVLCSAGVIVELAEISTLGVAAALLFAAMQLVFTRLGKLNFIGSLISEGLFYPMIMLMIALLLAWLRTRRTSVLLGLALLLVAMTQLRTAALLVITVPILAALCVLPRQKWRSTGVLVISATAAGLILMPPLLGKSILQVSTRADFTGFVLLPRVSLLPVPRSLAERSPIWVAMSSSWRAAASQLDAVALTQFDAALQEAIRFHLGPKVLVPAILNRSPDDIQGRVSNGTYYSDAKRIAIEWILAEWPTYLRLSGMHLWGLLTMADYMDNADRERVWKALNAVSASTWQHAPFRTDYPLNRIDERLSWTTNILYVLIRYASIVILILAAISATTVLQQVLGNQEVSPGSLAVVLAVGWSIAHSIPAALTVFPEERFTYANLLVMFSGGATWLAFLGANQAGDDFRPSNT